MSPSHEIYTPGYARNAVDFMARRTADSHAAFFLPHLKPGMRLLDCGCGPGDITVGLARRVSPGTVVGVDLGGAQLARARERAEADGVAATFQEANVYQLPFGEGEFEAVFSHALFEHLSEPLQALTEIRRTIKPGGVIGLRSPDWGGFVLHPWSGEIAAALADYQALQRANGGDVLAGRKLAAWLRETNFADVKSSASYEIYPEVGLIAEYLAQQLDQKGRTQSAATLLEWAKASDALFAQAWFEAVGCKA